MAGANTLQEGQSWGVVFGAFMDESTNRQQEFVSAVQYHDQCKDAADTERSKDSHTAVFGEAPFDPDGVEGGDDIGAGDPSNFLSDAHIPITEEAIEAYKKLMIQSADLRYGQEAVNIGQLIGILPVSSKQHNWSLNKPSPDVSNVALEVDFVGWRAALAADALAHCSKTSQVVVAQAVDLGGIRLGVNACAKSSQAEFGSVDALPLVGSTAKLVEVGKLLTAQKCAYNIIAQHLEATLSDSLPCQLLMEIQGEGGTRKPMVIRCISKLFKSKKCSAMLPKGAYTGIGASSLMQVPSILYVRDVVPEFCQIPPPADRFWCILPMPAPSPAPCAGMLDSTWNPAGLPEYASMQDSCISPDIKVITSA
jgi:hypothetical protein